jgi:5-hydroxyisourate hydrolase
VASLSTHVLDTATGRPASGIRVALERDGTVLARGVTDADGRVRDLAASLGAGTYRLVFEVAGAFFQRVGVDIEVGTEAHYHVPLLVSPYAVNIYRGS